MKTINSISIIASIAISLTTSHAGVTFSAPGLANPYTTPERQRAIAFANRTYE